MKHCDGIAAPASAGRVAPRPDAKQHCLIGPRSRNRFGEVSPERFARKADAKTAVLKLVVRAPQNGGCSSGVERLTVAQEVAGSRPVTRPTSGCWVAGVLGCLSGLGER